MRKLMIVGLLAALVVAVGALTATPAGANPPGTNGRIAFSRFEPALGDTVIYTINPDGSHEQQLFSPQVTAELPHWSADGTRIVDACCGLAAFIINPDTNSNVQLPMTNPNLLTFCWLWTPDSTRLACEAGFIDPSRQGIYTIRSSDGGGLTQITSNPGGDDIVSRYLDPLRHDAQIGEREFFCNAHDVVLVTLWEPVRQFLQQRPQVDPPGHERFGAGAQPRRADKEAHALLGDGVEEGHKVSAVLDDSRDYAAAIGRVIDAALQLL
jgi:hypothetical protein